MDWISINEHGLPKSGVRVLTYSEGYDDQPEMAFRILDSQFVKMCIEVTHYMYLKKPND